MRGADAKPVTRIRPEIQALRALAVVGTITFHTWPGYIPGGDAGVDVFFVVSGFLITGMLVREVDRTGGISFRRFYGRRIRRLLPAAYVVIAFSAVMTLTFVPRIQWGYFFHEMLAAALGVENWSELANSQSTDAVLRHLPPTPVLHYWSLGVEEQFYLVWPALILLIVWLVRRSRRRGSGFRTQLRWVFGVVAVASFIDCVLATSANVNLGYFATNARAWELAVGGLLALTPGLGRLPMRARILFGWAGLLAILGTYFFTWDQQHFPGWYALFPVLGAVAVIAAGTPQSAWSPSYLAQWAPIQAFGDASYSIYLWHWPIIFLFPFVSGSPTPWWGVLLLIALGIGVGFVSKRWIEDPLRSGARSREGTGVRLHLHPTAHADAGKATAEQGSPGNPTSAAG
ncbi:acyltransferase [Planctomonas sp. JC2975]|uniref:acyltransferase family protein n=1 Tax=Planctomonas sp. JC2975 TaxID=2729626 RepID=UPI001474D7F6|nr:acyltransferase [Planctomonas sp. JC2975]NNC12920.1 acyltransferase [Planctomonas sp. JC2975]